MINNSIFSIYVLDDSKIILEMMDKVISSVVGVSVAVFGNSASFMEKMTTETPDLIFLDFYLDTRDKTELNGEEVFRMIKLKNSHIPIILLTGINDAEKVAHFKEIGFSEVIDKNEPLIFNHILNSVNRFTSGSLS